jgi:hypothetical protein
MQEKTLHEINTHIFQAVQLVLVFHLLGYRQLAQFMP